MKSRNASRKLAVAVFLGLAATSFPSPGFGFGRADVDEEAARFASTKPARLQPFYRQLYRDGEWGAVLNYEQLGLAAMDTGDFETARRSFDEAIGRIEQIYANDENARQALSMFNEEKVKDFKGEPYERAMAYYYRGLLYARDGDFENARAAFLAADLQDTMAERETYAGDFGVMKYLAGWASMCAGDETRARNLIQEAKAVDPSIASLEDVPGRALMLIDAGPSPIKRSTGKHKEVLTFEKAADQDDGVSVKVGGASAELQTAGDVYFQASTRGGRQVDGVLAGKARFKDDAKAVGDIATSVGQVAMMQGLYSDRSNLAGAGALIGLLGLVAQGVSAATTPGADTRSWQSLPSQLLLRQQPEPYAGEMTVVSSSGERPISIRASHGKCSIYWGRTRSALGTGEGGSVRLVDDPIQEDGRGDKNQAFRQRLRAERPDSTVAADGAAR